MNTLKHPRRARKRVRAFAVGALASITLAFGLATTALGDSATIDVGTAGNGLVYTGTMGIADDSTLMTYSSDSFFPTNGTTANAGQLWTDKSVFVPGSSTETTNIPLSDGTTVEVDKTASGTFLTSMSVLSSSLTTEFIEPQPLDIVLVLDVSGSMHQGGWNAYIPFTEEQMMAITVGTNSLGSNVFFRNRSGANGGYTNKQGWEGYIQVSKDPGGADAQTVPYLDKGGDYYILIRNDSTEKNRRNVGKHEDWYYSMDNGATWSTEPYDFMYTLLYRRGMRYNIDELHDAASDFAANIAENNSTLAAAGYGDEKMSRISIVKFSGQYPNGTYDTPDYTIGSDNNGRTQIVTPLTAYTDDNVSSIQNTINGLQANGSTAADCGLILAKGVLDGHAVDSATGEEQPGARQNAQKVVVFFTDGNPKHVYGTNPTDFSGLIAQQTWDVARDIKEDGTLIYSVAVVNGANAEGTTNNVDIYLHGVSSNYLNAVATNGQDGDGKTVSGLIPPDRQNVWDPDLKERNEAYTPATDTEIIASKTYYERTGSGTGSDPYVYVAVANPTAEELENYYEKINYYLVAGNNSDKSLAEAFQIIANQITSGGGEDTISTGRDGNTAVTITDYLGDYMEFKGLNGIIYGTEQGDVKLYAPGTQGAAHEQAQVQHDDISATDSTYTMWYSSVDSALLHPPAGQEQVNLNLITVQVSRSTDPKQGDTVTIKVPPELIPSIRYKTTESTNLDGESVYTTTRSEADPIRILYTVGPKANTVSDVIAMLDEQALRSENAANDSDRQTVAYKDFLVDAAAGRKDIFSLYNNAPTTEAEGTTEVKMTLSESNPYYFFVHDKLYRLTEEGGEETYLPATAADVQDLPATLYYRDRVFQVGDKQAAHKDEWVPFTIESEDDFEYSVIVDGQEYTLETDSEGDYITISTDYYVRGGKVTIDGNEYPVSNGKVSYNGAEYPVVDGKITVATTHRIANGKVAIGDRTYPVSDGYITIASGKLKDIGGISASKGEGNRTETALDVIDTVFNPEELDVNNNHVARQHLGNNGRLDIPIKGTLAITKNITAGAGFTLPADPVPEMDFTIEFFDAGGQPLDGSFKALLRQADGRPLDRTTHRVPEGDTPAADALFTISGGGTFTLRDGETLKITGLPDGSTYKVTEAGEKGYRATVTNNDESTETFDRGEEASTADAADSGTSTIKMAKTQKVVFDNEYKPDPVIYEVPEGLITKVVQTEEDYSLDEGRFSFAVYESDGFDQNTHTGTLVATGTNLEDSWDALDGNDRAPVDQHADTRWTNIWVDGDGEELDPQPDPDTVPSAEAHPRFWFETPGTYTYYVVEDEGDEPGVTYAGTVYTLRIVVTSVNGELVVTPTYYLGSTMEYPTIDPDTYEYDYDIGRQISFENIYSPNGVFSSPTDDGQDITVTKALMGRSIRVGEFAYALYAEDDWDVGGGKPKVDPETGETANPVARGISGEGTYDEATGAYSAPVTINQIARESSGDSVFYLVELGQDNSGNGVTYDHGVYKVTSHVTVNGDTFDVVWSLDQADARDSGVYEDDIDEEGKGGIYFNNAYTPAPDSTDGETITKTLAGRDWIDSDDFKIKVEAEEGAPELQFGKAVDGKGEVVDEDQPDASLSHEDGSTTYIYTLDDSDNDNAASFKAGVRTITAEHFAGVREQEYTEGGITFMAKRKSWTYTISEILPDDDDPDTAGVQKDGVTYDGHTATVTVTATDNLEGKITTAVSVSGSTTFANAYAADVTVSPLAVTKTLKNHSLAADTFLIGISAGTNEWSQAKLGAANLSTASHGAADMDETGSATSHYTDLGGLNSIVFTEADLKDALTDEDGKRARDYTYRIGEIEDTTRSSYLDYDKTAYDVVITLIDDGKGSLSTVTNVYKLDDHLNRIEPAINTKTCTGDEDTDEKATVGFVNTYKAVATFSPTITKELDGRPAHEGEFGFFLTKYSATDTNGNGTYEPGEVVKGIETATNIETERNAASALPFSEQTFDIPQLEALVAEGFATKTTSGGNATYTLEYTVTEGDNFAGGTFPDSSGKTGTDKNKEGKPLGENGITERTIAGESQSYDADAHAWPAPASASYTVTLTDDGNGHFEPIYSYGPNGLAFVNTYKADGAALLQASKHLSGQTLREATSFTVGGRTYDVNEGVVVIDGTEYAVSPDNTITITEGANAGTYAAESIFVFDLNTDETYPQAPAEVDGDDVTPIKQVRNDLPSADDPDQFAADATFGLVSFNQDDVRVAPYVYVITENQVDHKQGYTYSPEVKLIMPVLVDNEDGTLSMRTGLGSEEYFNISGSQTDDENAHYIAYDVDGDGSISDGEAVLRLEPINHDMLFDNSYSIDSITQSFTATKLMPEGGLASKIFNFQLVPEEHTFIDGTTGHAPLPAPKSDGNEALTDADEDADTQSLWLFTAGNDGIIGTFDDVDVTQDETQAANAEYARATNNFSSVNLGSIRFTEAGTYAYRMKEIIPAAALAEINTTASPADQADVTSEAIGGINYTSRDSLAEEYKDNTGLTWRVGDYLYDDTQYLVTVKVSDHGEGRLVIDDISYENLGTTVRPEENDPSPVAPRFLNHNTLRAGEAQPSVTIAKQLIGRNYWVNRFEDPIEVKYNYFPTQVIQDETYAFTIDSLGQAAAYAGEAPIIDPATGLPVMRHVPAFTTVGGNEYPVYQVTYWQDVSAKSTMFAYFDGGQGKYVEVNGSIEDGTFTLNDDGTIIVTDSASPITVKEGGTSIATIDYNTSPIEVGIKDMVNAPMPKRSEGSGTNITDHWPDEDYLAIVPAQTADSGLDALSKATISRDFTVIVPRENLVGTGTSMMRADYYYRMYETAPNSATVTIPEDVTFDGETIAAGTYVLRDGTDTWDQEWSGVPTEEEYWEGYPEGDDQFTVDQEVAALIENGTYKVDTTGKLRAYVSQHPELEWTYKGVTYQAKPYYVHVEVHSTEGSESLLASVSYSDGTIVDGQMKWTTGGSTIPIFVNTYDADGEATIDVTKELLDFDWANTVWSSGDEGDAADEGFVFEISPVGTAPLPEDDNGNVADTISVTKDSDGSGTMRTGHSLPIAFKLTDLRQTETNGIAEGDFIYRITEATPDGEVQGERGLTYDEKAVYAKVHVVDSMDGTLKTEVSYYTDSACTHEIELDGKSTGITYEPTHDTSIDPLKTYYRYDADTQTYMKVWRPLDEDIEGYFEQEHHEGAIFTNTGMVEVKVEKIWDDADNQDGTRPESVTVRLLANGADTGRTLALDENNDWKGAFEELERNDTSGEPIAYTVAEGSELELAQAGYNGGPDNYISPTPEGNIDEGFTITNTHAPETVDVTITKVWQDSADESKRPEASDFADRVTIRAGESELEDEVPEVADNGDGTYTVKFAGLPKYEDGKEIAYTVVENEAPEGYAITEGDGGVTDGGTIVNTLESALIDIEGTKQWREPEAYAREHDNEDEIELTLTRTASGATETVEAEPEWNGDEFTFSGLPELDAKGARYTYEIAEAPIAGYDTTYDGFDITNTMVTTTVSGKKLWIGDESLGMRPASIELTLLAGSDEVATEEIDGSNAGDTETEWSYSFEDLPAYDEDGKAIDYAVTERDVPSGYECTELLDGLVIVNIAQPFTVKVTKTWSDGNNQDGKRPADIALVLKRSIEVDGGDVEDSDFEKNVTLTGPTNIDGSWTLELADLPQFDEDGNEYTYYIDEETDAPDGYTSTIDGLTVTNERTPDKVTVRATKTWEDNDNAEGLRPESITYQLLADGIEQGDPQTATSDGNWAAEFTNLPRYANGKEINYQIVEKEVDGYSTTFERDKDESGNVTYAFTNARTPETLAISGEKLWLDDDDAANMRPESIKVQLLANGSEQGDPQTVTGDGNIWHYEFTDLPRYVNGSEVTYTVDEVKVPCYTTTKLVAGKGTHDQLAIYDFVNTLDTTSIDITKKWDDADDQDGLRPESLTIDVLANGETYKTVSLTGATDTWTATADGLPECDADGKDIEWTVAEPEVEGYDSEITGSAASGFTITNTHAPATVEIPVTKVWSDNGDQDSERPGSVTVRLLADGTEIDHAVITAGDGETWSTSFNKLPKYRDGGTEIAYAVTEDAVSGYSTEITGSAAEGFTVTNSYTPGKTSVTVTKKWDDADDQDGLRPGSINVQLKAGDDAQGDPVTLNEDNQWTHTWNNLDERVDGEAIAYTVDEAEMPTGYEQTITGDATAGFVIANAHEPATTSVDIAKVWNDADNQDGLRPDDITLQLDADGKTIQTVELTEANADTDDDSTWATTIEGLPKFANGKEITYTANESLGDVPAGYTASASGLTVTNKHVPATGSVHVHKTWNDADDQDGLRPTAGEFADLLKLEAGGEAIDASPAIEKLNGNTYVATWDNLPAYANGTAISYRVAEGEIEGYTLDSSPAAITLDENGYQIVDISNSHTPATTETTVTKVWDDGDNQDGVRPEAVELVLLADGEPTGDGIIKLTSEDAVEGDAGIWSAKVSDLPKCAGGEEIAYAIAEPNVPAGYAVEYSEDGLTATNKHIAETGTITANKVWIDDDNQDGKRADVKFTLTGTVDGESEPVYTDEQTVTIDATVDDGEVSGSVTWGTEDEPLPVKHEGKTIAYSVEETDAPDGYAATVSRGYDGVFTVTNTYRPELGTAAVTKEWAGDDPDLRPDHVTYVLKADGEQVEETTATGDMGATWKNLPVYVNGSKVLYTVEEQPVEGYEATIDPADGQTLTAGETASFTVTNAYLGKAAKAQVALTKAIDAADLVDLEAGQFEFQLIQTVDGEDTVIATAENDADGKVSFDPLTLLPGTYTYTVHESSAATTGWENAKDLTVTIRVKDNGDGTASVNGTLYEDDPIEVDAGTMTNVYAPAGSFTLGAQKKLKGRDFLDSDIFTFLLEATGDNASEAPMPSKTWYELKGSDALGQIANGAENASFDFGTVKLTRDMVGKEFTYTVHESVGGAGGITYDGDTKTIKLKVVNKDDGTLGYEMIEDTVLDPLFENEYTIPVSSVVLAAKKTLAGRPLANKEFEFQVKDTDGEVVATARNKADGSITFPAIDLPSTGTFSYTISEVIPADVDAVEGMTYSDTVCAVKIVVSDELQNGKPAVEVTYDDGTTPPTFENVYTAREITVTASKTWAGDEGNETMRGDVVLHLIQNRGDDKIEIGTKTIPANATGDDLTVTWENQPVEVNGDPVTYTVTEDKIDGYRIDYGSQVDDAGNATWTVTNTRVANIETELVGRVEAKKVWNDDRDPQPEHPSVALRLIGFDPGADDGTGAGVVRYAFEATANSANDWTAVWEDIPATFNGRTLQYEVQEVTPVGYTLESVSPSERVALDPEATEPTVFTVTNKPAMPTGDVSATKKWLDDNDRDGKRVPTKLVLQKSTDDGATWADLEDADLVGVTMESSTDGESWTEVEASDTYTVNTDYGVQHVRWRDLATATVLPVADDDTGDDVSDDEGDGPTVEDEGDGDGEEDVSPEAGIEATVLYRIVELAESDNGDVDANDDASALHKAGYQAVVSQTGDGAWEIGNVHTPDVQNVSVKVGWVDNDRPASVERGEIVYELVADGMVVDTVTLSGEDATTWNGAWFDVPVYRDNGTPIVYEVRQTTSPDGYTGSPTKETDEGTEVIATVENGVAVITNTYNGARYTVAAEKVWLSKDGEIIEPKTQVNVPEATFELVKAVGDNDPVLTGERKTIGNIALTDTMRVEWTDLPAYENGEAIVWSVDEVSSTVGSGSFELVNREQTTDEETGVTTFTFTNKLKVDKYDPTNPDDPIGDDDVIKVTYIDPLNAEGSQILLAQEGLRKAITGAQQLKVVGGKLFTGDPASPDGSPVDATVPSGPVHSGHTFTGWMLNQDQYGDYTLVAMYDVTPEQKQVMVVYVDPLTGNIIVKEQQVDANKKGSVTPPADPSHKGYTFIEWKKGTDLAGNDIYVATYKCNGGSNNGGGSIGGGGSSDNGGSSGTTVKGKGIIPRTSDGAPIPAAAGLAILGAGFVLAANLTRKRQRGGKHLR